MDNQIEKNPVSPTGQAVSGSPTVQKVGGNQAAQVVENTAQARPAAKTMTRAQVEEKYTKLLEDTLKQLEALEASVRAATNTKIDIKTGTKALGTCFREFLNIAKSIGMTRFLEATEQRVRYMQQQQQQQHVQTMKLISEIREEQLQHQQITQQKIDTLIQSRQAESLGGDLSWAQDKINSQEERFASQGRKLDKLIFNLEQFVRAPADRTHEQQHRQQKPKQHQRSLLQHQSETRKQQRQQKQQQQQQKRQQQQHPLQPGMALKSPDQAQDVQKQDPKQQAQPPQEKLEEKPEPTWTLAVEIRSIRGESIITFITS